jgi:peptide/nickel transport system substrate-binding protein
LEPLVGVTEDLELSSDPDAQQPGLAKDWTVSDDKMEYELTLRDGVKFHDGSDLTSADVKYSYERIMDPDVGASHNHIFKKIDTVETPDDQTVRITLGETYQPFLRQLTYLATVIMPEGSAGKQVEEPIGTGPFKFESRQQGDKIVMSGFDDYWNEGPYIDTLEQRSLTDPDTRLTTLQTGDVNYTNDIPLSKVQEIVGNDSDDIETRTWNPLCFAFLPMNNGEPPFDDRNFRHAIDYAIDKQELVDGALYGFGEPIESPSFPDSKYRNNNLESRKRDFELARSLIEQSAYGIDEFSIEFKVSPNYPWHVDAATIMQQHFTQVGLDVSIQQLQWGEWLQQVIVDQNYTLAMVNWFDGWEPTYIYRNIWHSEGQFNFLNYASDQFDSTLDEASTATSEDAAGQKYNEAQSVLHEELPSLQVWFRKGAMGGKSNVKGMDTILNPNHSFVQFDRVWLEQ